MWCKFLVDRTVNTVDIDICFFIMHPEGVVADRGSGRESCSFASSRTTTSQAVTPAARCSTRTPAWSASPSTATGKRWAAISPSNRICSARSASTYAMCSTWSTSGGNARGWSRNWNWWNNSGGGFLLAWSESDQRKFTWIYYIKKVPGRMEWNLLSGTLFVWQVCFFCLINLADIHITIQQ